MKARFTLMVLPLLTLPAIVHAQFTYTTNNGTITITGYTGPGGDVTIPDFTDGRLVTRIGDSAFRDRISLTSVTIPGSVTNMGSYVFLGCAGLTNVTIPNSLTNIGWQAFDGCSSLTGITLPDSIATIEYGAFANCGLTSITIPDSVTSIWDMAFAQCIDLTSVRFQGDAPSLGGRNVFSADESATLYYLPGTTGWGPTFGGRPAAFWLLPRPLILSHSRAFGIQTNQFGFIISWATNIPVVVEASATLAHPAWSPINTNDLTNGSAYFSDARWTNYSSRFYRLRSL